MKSRVITILSVLIQCLLWQGLILGQCLILECSSFAQTSSEDKKKAFGSYHESNLDLEVKVSGGSIKIYRVWRGDKKQWSINPQHKSLELSEETQGSAYGHLLAKEIARGPRNLSQQGGLIGFYARSSSSSGGGGGGSASGITANTAIFLGAEPTIRTCTNEGEGASEAVAVNQNGYKWISRIGREWAQYNFEGGLIEFGEGNFRVGSVLRDNA